MNAIAARILAGEAPFEPLFSVTLGTSANLLLLGATLLYVAHLWWPGRALGRAATGLALFGALGLLGSLLAFSTETWGQRLSGHLPLTGQREVMALFSACTVLIYLVMERAYRSRSAGAFVMPLVAAAVLFDGWLSASEQPAVIRAALVLRNYELRAHVMSDFIGFGAFAVAAAMSVMLLLRERADRGGARAGFAMRLLPASARSEQLMHQVIGFGFPFFILGTLLGMHIAYGGSGHYMNWSLRESWTLLVGCAYAGYFFLRHACHWRGVRVAWWLLAGFCLSVVGLLCIQMCVNGKLCHV